MSSSTFTRIDPRFVENSKAVLKLSESGKISGIITASMVTDIYYILNRFLKDAERVKLLIWKLLGAVDLADVMAKDVTAAFTTPMPDFEDALLAQCAKRVKADFIVTRNVEDFQNSPVPAMTPDDFLHRFFPG
jgi:predicted nucleic acid-binding protein